ncbi:hypothetical protein [Vulcanisaeta sp. JCM 14467]|nr:hypothetical protein [Vulcanisaeta sp. JCM 14467]
MSSIDTPTAARIIIAISADGLRPVINHLHVRRYLFLGISR